VLWGGRLQADERVVVPDAAFGHVFVARGSAEFEAGGELATGDAVRLQGGGGHSLVAGSDGAEVLVWTTGAMA
jgi:hypothetical protein